MVYKNILDFSGFVHRPVVYILENNAIEAAKSYCCM
jgi:hypothetical protein